MLITDEQLQKFKSLGPAVISDGREISNYRTSVLETMLLDRDRLSEADRIKIENILERRRKTILDDKAGVNKVYSNYKPLPVTDPGDRFQAALVDVINEVFSMLLEKNRKYGNSVSEPVGVFSKLSPIEAINVRIDDKLSRIRSGQPDETEDSELDLIGYLILKRILRLYEPEPE